MTRTRTCRHRSFGVAPQIAPMISLTRLVESGVSRVTVCCTYAILAGKFVLCPRWQKSHVYPVATLQAVARSRGSNPPRTPASRFLSNPVLLRTFCCIPIPRSRRLDAPCTSFSESPRRPVLWFSRLVPLTHSSQPSSASTAVAATKHPRG